MKFKGLHDYYDWVSDVHGADPLYTVVRQDLPTVVDTARFSDFSHQFASGLPRTVETEINTAINQGPKSGLPTWGTGVGGSFMESRVVAARLGVSEFISIGGNLYYQPNVFLKKGRGLHQLSDTYLADWRRYDNALPITQIFKSVWGGHYRMTVKDKAVPLNDMQLHALEEASAKLAVRAAATQMILGDLLLKLHRDYDRPILRLHADTVRGGPRLGFLNIDIDYKQPHLADLGFAKLIDPMVVYGDLDYYMRNERQGSPDAMPKIEVTEAVKVAQKGFDKQSFRRSKQK